MFNLTLKSFKPETTFDSSNERKAAPLSRYSLRNFHFVSLLHLVPANAKFDRVWNVMGIIPNETNCQIVSPRNRISPGDCMLNESKKRKGKRKRKEGTNRKKRGAKRARRAKKAPLLFQPAAGLPIRSLSNIISSRDVTGLQLRERRGLSISRETKREEREIREEYEKGSSCVRSFLTNAPGSAEAVCRCFAVTAAAIRAAISPKKPGKIKIIVKHRNTAFDA